MINHNVCVACFSDLTSKSTRDSLVDNDVTRASPNVKPDVEADSCGNVDLSVFIVVLKEVIVHIQENVMTPFKKVRHAICLTHQLSLRD